MLFPTISWSILILVYHYYYNINVLSIKKLFDTLSIKFLDFANRVLSNFNVDYGIKKYMLLVF